MENYVTETGFLGRGEVKGFSFTQVEKGEKSVIWRVNTGCSEHFEVWRRKVNKRFGVESKPSSKAFGVWAWTFSDLESALKKFSELETLPQALKKYE